MSARSDSQSDTSRDDELLAKGKPTPKSNLQIAVQDDYLDSEVESEDNWEETDGLRERVKSSDAGKPKSRRSSLYEEQKKNFEQATKIFQDINMNNALLEKLKQELVALKTKYAENQMELANAQNESIKLNKQKDSQEKNITKIVPGLLQIAIDDSEEGSETNLKPITNYDDLALKIKQCITSGNNIRIEFIFRQDTGQGKSGKVKKIKKNFDFGMGKIADILTKVKNTFDLSYEELKNKPHILEPDEQSLKLLEKDVLETLAFSQEAARKNAEKYLKSKFFPADQRLKLWLGLAENKANVGSKLFKCYAETVDKKVAENDNYGCLPMIKTNIRQSLESWGLSEDKPLEQSVARILLVFEYYQPNIGYVPGLEKIVLFFRKLTDEPSAFVLLYCCLFNSRLLWSFMDGKKTLTEFNLQILERMCTHNAKLAKSYETNRRIFERFFVETATLLFVDVFDPAIVERVIDHFVVFGEGALYILMICIVEECADLDLTDLLIEDALKELVICCKKLDPLRIYHKLLTSFDMYDFFALKKKEIIK